MTRANPERAWTAGPRLKIRKRERRGYVREAQGYAAWTEWQVVQGRKVVARFDHEADARNALSKASGTETKDEKP